MLLCYKIYWSLLASRFLTKHCFILQTTSFIIQYWCSVFYCSVRARAWVYAGCLHPWSIHRLCLHVGSVPPTRIPCATQIKNVTVGGGGGWVGLEELKLRSRLRKMILAQNLLHQSQSGTLPPVRLVLPQRTG